CVFTTTYTNREQDKAAAEKVSNQLFKYLKDKNYEAASGLFSKEFYSVTPKNKLKGMFAEIQNDLGDLKTDSLAECNTKVITGTDQSSEYFLIYKNHHKKHDGVDSIRMLKEADGKIRIVFFHVGY
ncbi:MAG TPA: hypothetical protein VHS53_17710, partial [Mucilaginibacter sp.]|nr:hypothetical protein [Mucilaginibacter sp.]